ncbi:MAG TPA: glycosyl hydrolase, partial [Thermoanaerobaculia bacterium]|nr:glycosyl hydrolase [Thermoanaerobaculia bacterium]
WRSTNGGRDWEPVFDDQPTHSIGSIAVAPSDPNVVWVGAGEANIRGNVARGNGVYRSTDRGKTWTHVLTLAGQIGSMAVDPRDADVAFAAVLGSPFGAGADRGVYRTLDGGKSWKKVLYVDEQTGAADVTLDPHNPRIVFAGTWQVRRYPWDLESGGPGSGLWVSRDGGESWKRLRGDGLPEGIWGKVGVRVAPSDSQRVYALIEAEAGGLFRSDNGGESWEHASASRGIRQRAWYYSCLTIDPGKPDVVWFPEVSMLKTIDGGKTIRSVKGGGWDHHDVWIDPSEPKRMIVASDAGVSLSSDGGESWYRPPMAIAQLYHVITDSRTPYRVLAAAQDWGTVSGPSNSLHGGGILLSDWHGVGGGEAGHVAPETDDPDIVYAGEYLGFISRYDEKTGIAPHVGIYPDNGSGHGAKDLRYRFQWTAPILVSPHDPKVVYHAGNVLFRSSDGGQHWQAISPDLTRNDPDKQKWSGGPITGDNTGVEFYDTIFALAESPLTAGVLWAGSDDGLVHVSRDGGGGWKAVTPPGTPQWATVEIIEASRWDPGTAYVVADAHRLDDMHPYLWVTTDYGASWKSLSKGLDEGVYLHAVREDSVQRGLLYLASERGVMLSRDAGGSWQSLKLNLPAAVAVSDLAVHGDDLVVGTIGRSLWVLDDLGPVRQWSAAIAKEALRLFPPRQVVAWHVASAPFGSDWGSASNPPAGAGFTYWLKAKPKGKLTLDVLDAQGKVVRTLSSELEPSPIGPEHPDWSPTAKPEPDLDAEPGLHRAEWDLALAGAPYIPKAMVDTGDPHAGPTALPGDYTLRLTADGQTATQPLRVLPDPRVTTPRADQEVQHAFLLLLRDRMSEIARMVESIRSVRGQLEARATQLADRQDAADLVTAGKELVAKLTAVEKVLHNPEAEVTYDILAGRDGGTQLHSRYAGLNEAGRDLPG